MCRLLPYNKELLKNIDGLSVFVKNLPPSYTHKDLFELFSSVGAIKSCKISLNENHQNNGFGYVAYENEKLALKAIEVLNGKTLDDKQLEVAPYKRQGTTEPKFNNLYVKEFPLTYTEDDIKKLFG